MLVTCQRLSVLQMTQPGSKERSVELEATGNAFVEGRTFTARGSRIAYDQAKDQLILEGSGRALAELARQQVVGGPVSTMSAGRILYWRKTNSAQMDDARFLDSGAIPVKRDGRR